MSETDSVLRRVATHLVEASDSDLVVDQVGAETSLRDDLDMNSLQAITVVLSLEDEFDMVIEDEEMETLQTVGDILALIREKREAGP